VPVATYAFGEFELDCARFELRRNGRALKLERIPMELLILLAEKDGNVVTRQRHKESRPSLWGRCLLRWATKNRLRPFAMLLSGEETRR
jgi:hypothetical protein